MSDVFVLQNTLGPFQNQHHPHRCVCLYKYRLPEQVWQLQGLYLEKQPGLRGGKKCWICYLKKMKCFAVKSGNKIFIIDIH